jgi:PAS domain S-box-containing protein
MTAAAPDILTLTRDARLAPYAMSAIPTWVWGADASRVIWANASGAAALGAPSVAALSERSFSAAEPLGADVARLAETLPPTAQKYERLRDIGTSLVCSCARVEIAGTPGILVIASEPGRTALPLAERAARLFGASHEPLAVFSADGALLYATGDLEPGMTLSDLGADALKADAIASGHASGESKLGMLTLDRLGSGGNTVLLATLPAAHDSAEAPGEHVSEQAEEAEAPKIEEELSSPSIAEAGASIEPPSPVSEEPAAVEASPIPAPGERPLRFVWTMDAQEHFQLAAPAFADAMGPLTAALIGKPWREIAATLGIDPDGRVANAIASRDTWSGIVIAWPAEATGDTVNVELSGLPIFDRERNFTGYRGFGMCRDGARTVAPPLAAPPSPPAQDVPPKETEPRPLLTVVPAAKNVVPFRGSTPEKRPVLTPVESSAFAEIAETLKNGTPDTPAPPAMPEAPAESSKARETEPAEPEAMPSAFATAPADTGAAQKNAETQLAVLERLPVGVLIHRNEQLIYANRAFLEWTGYADLAAVAAAGGLERLVVDPQAGSLDRVNGTGKTFTIAARTGDTLTCEGRLYSVPWNGESALMLVLVRTAAADRLRDSEIALRAAEAEARELRSILDTATDGVIVTDRDGLILTFNRSAEALFGYEYHEMARRPFTELFAPESERAARDYLDGLTKNGVASVLNDGREVIGRVRQGGLIPLFMTMGRIGDGMPKFCAVLRDITQWKRAEEDLLNAKRTAERASSAKSDFLAKISHEIRTPLNAIIGFSEVMMKEQFGPIGNERYREYMKDIHSSGEHLVSLINDLLDLSKIEAGKLDLVFASVNLNALVQQCVALMQPQANQQRIIIRSSLSQTLPPVVADARSVRQIVLNLLSNSIKFTGAGGQVIVSTALTDRGEAVLRVRDTGIGMTDKEIETAMEPFRQLATSTRYGSGGTGLGLPLTKALAEANRAAFTIKSAVDSGTLVEITFPGTRVLAE